MIQSRFASALALAAFLAVPAFAQTDSNSPTVNGATVAPLEKNAAKQSAAAPGKQATADGKRTATMGSADVSSGTRTVDGAYVAPLEKNSANQQAKADADCDMPNAGKLADKSTGVAKEHSASAVHKDCAPGTKISKSKKKSTKTASNTSQ